MCPSVVHLPVVRCAKRSWAERAQKEHRPEVLGSDVTKDVAALLGPVLAIATEPTVSWGLHNVAGQIF